jgi:hypothetical protein
MSRALCQTGPCLHRGCWERLTGLYWLLAAYCGCYSLQTELSMAPRKTDTGPCSAQMFGPNAFRGEQTTISKAEHAGLYDSHSLSEDFGYSFITCLTGPM